MNEILLVALLFFHNGSELIATKPIPSDTNCNELAAELIFEAAKDGSVRKVAYRCVTLHGRNVKDVALATAKDLKE